ncbi:hypothetical protein NDU88_005110 [Pleurodeles waltl]|uniref:Uncharacterized protein n=1 Tax=Pleurodeles waltl TaxID=8319 RepID=A0AAV7VKK0_PLEWA|nr:hypothetical protein NDU88_005110 [Pleurodeles waltl]
MHWQCPWGTHQSDDHPEENPNPDIRVGAASPGREKEKTEPEEMRDSREQEEEKSMTQNERSQKEDDQGEERRKGFEGEALI